MGFGAGVLISAVAYELVEDAFGPAGGSGAVALGLLAGAFTILRFHPGEKQTWVMPAYPRVH